MPRHSYKRLPVDNDVIYGTYEIAKLINYVMRNGKKNIARKIVYKVLDAIKKEGEDPIRVFYKALSNVSPQLEVRPCRIGGASYLVPQEVRQERKLYLALKWILDAAKARPNKDYHTFDKKLLAELKDASNNQGSAVQKRLQVEKVAETNKVFSHLKW